MKSPLSIYVLVDALGWEIIRDRPFLDDVLEERRWLQTILGYSSGAIPTILSGRLPSQHGHWNLFYRSPATSPFRWTRALRRLPAPFLENPVSRRAVKHLSRLRSGYSGYFSIYAYPIAGLAEWDLTEKRDIYRPGGLDCPSFFDQLLARNIPYECYNYHGHTDPEILALGARRAVESDARVLFLYLADLDRYLRSAGPTTSAATWPRSDCPTATTWRPTTPRWRGSGRPTSAPARGWWSSWPPIPAATCSIARS